MSEHLIWGIGLFVTALLLVVVELFIPSGGLIAILAGMLGIGAVIKFFMEGTSWGVTSLLFYIVLIPIIFNFAIKIMPHTPIGRKMILGLEDEDELQQRELADQQQRAQERALVGSIGKAVTDCRPIGTAEIEGIRTEVLAEGGAIDAGDEVRITHVEGNQITVRRV